MPWRGTALQARFLMASRFGTEGRGLGLGLPSWLLQKSLGSKLAAGASSQATTPAYPIYPGAASGCPLRSFTQPCQLPQYGSCAGPRSVRFEDCSAFTCVAACTLARSPIRDPLSEGFSHYNTKEDISPCPLCMRNTMLSVAALLHLEATRIEASGVGRAQAGGTSAGFRMSGIHEHRGLSA